MKEARSFVPLALASALLAAPVLAQEEPPVINETIDVRVVNVETVVTDGDGKLVKGLTAADFRLLVDGKETPIDYFSEISEGGINSKALAMLAEVDDVVQKPYERGRAAMEAYLRWEEALDPHGVSPHALLPNPKAP